MKNGVDKGRGEMMPCICGQKGNQIILYGTFNNIKAADNFMDELAEFLGAKAGEQE